MGTQWMRMVVLGAMLAAVGGCTKQNPAAVLCEAASDCSSDAPICDATAGTCRVCVADADCLALGAGLSACTPAGTCVECLSASDCGAGSCVDQTCVAGCQSDADCGGDEPACDTGTGACVGCVDSTDCASAEAPTCEPASNTCVECVESSECDGGALVCAGGSCGACSGDAECTVGSRDICDDGQCVECTAHGDCSSGACDYDTGLCFPDAVVLYAGGDDSTRDTDCGTRVNPCSHLEDAAAKTTTERFVIRLLGEVRLEAQIRVTGRELRVVSPARVIIDNAGIGETRLLVAQQGVMRFEGISLGVFAVAPASCDAARLEFLNSELFVDDDGINASDCRVAIIDSVVGVIDATANGSDVALASVASLVRIERTDFFRNGQNGRLLQLLESDVIIRNNLFRESGPSSVSITRRSNPQIESAIEFNTIVSASGNLASPIECSQNLVLRNSIVIRPEGALPLQCPVEFSLVPGGAPGTGNVDADPAFVPGSLRPAADSPAIDSARDSPGVVSDFDGNPRPAGNGYDMGAFEAQP